ncbi:MAG: transporter permease protein [Bacilli bacterium]|nr:transporter permease protein [Bacilli bacterium]
MRELKASHGVATFLSVYAPLAGPIAATAIILTFMSSWNDFLWPLIVLTDNKLQTLPLFLASFTQQYGNYSGLSMATTTLSILPVIVVFIIFQKYVIQSVALSGLKGE